MLDRCALTKRLHRNVTIGRALERRAGQRAGQEGGGGHQAAGESLHRSVNLNIGDE